MEYFNRESISLYLKLYLKIALFLVFVMPFLYMADASAYARCSDPGICEFLDIPGICESLDLLDISKETQQGISTSSMPEKVIYAQRRPLIKSCVLNYTQQLHLSILRYKDHLYNDLILSPFFTALWFWKLILPGSKPFCFEIKERIFFPFNQSILKTSIIIS